MSSETKPKSGARRAYLVLGTMAVLVLGVYFIHQYMTRDEVATDDAQIDADVLPVSARVSGTVLHVKVEDNQRVEAGQVIAELDPIDYMNRVAAAAQDLETALDQAEGADNQVEIVRSSSTGGLSSAKAQLEGTGASVRGAQAQVAAASASLARAKADLFKASTDFERADKLHAAGAVSGQALEAAKAARDASQAAVDAATANLAAARDQQALSESRVIEARGHVEQSAPVNRQVAVAESAAKQAHSKAQAAQLALDNAKQQLSYTKITAPVAGYVSKLAVHDGQFVQPGTMVVMVVPVRTFVVANFKETQIERIAPGDPVEITVDAVGGTFHGKVVSIAAATGARFSMMPPDNATGNFVKVVQRVPVKISLDDGQPLERLHAGLSAEVTLHLQHGKP